jgi:hypothetical protein
MNLVKRLSFAAAIVVLSGSVAPAQTPATGRVMREKLAHSQKILEAILTSKFTLLDTESAALAKATQSPAWSALKGPEYLRQSEAFLKALDELRTAARDRDLDGAVKRYTDLTMTAARDRDLDGAVKRYTDLTMSCFACHRYMKDRRLADR